jgi:hypothetical protein
MAVMKPLKLGFNGAFLSNDEMTAILKAQKLKKLEMAEETRLQKKYKFDP